MFNFLSVNTTAVVYNVFFGCVYGCIAAILVLAWIFGRRARRNVKKESVTRLAEGFSPLDVKRIFIGKTFPRRLTRALVAYWAHRGYITVEYQTKYTVKLTKINPMPAHFDEKAVFFDRGTYVRERELFDKVFSGKRKGMTKKSVTIDLRRPMFTKNEVTYVNKHYAVREDEGVYSAMHYTLKIITLILSVVPFALCAAWCGIDSGNFASIVLVFMAIIGMTVLKFVRGMPIIFKLIWCGMWLGASVGVMFAFFKTVYDPYGIIYASALILFAGPLFFIRFVDYREKNNLSDYSDLVNYRKFLAFGSPEELSELDYSEVLPFLYAFNIKPFVHNKYNRTPPDWYIGDPDGRGALL